MTRAWQTSTGDYLIEGDRAATTTAGLPIRDGGDVPLTEAYTYWLLDPSRTVRSVYDTGGDSIDDDLYGSAHLVAGGALQQYHTGYHTTEAAWDDEQGAYQHRNWEHTVHDGLIEVSFEAAMGVGTGQAATDAFVATRAQWHRREQLEREEAWRPVRELEASFDAALPAEPVDLVFGYDTGPLVRRAVGTVIWRPPATWSSRGKDLHHILTGVIERRWGRGITWMRLDIDAAPWWYWDPID